MSTTTIKQQQYDVIIVGSGTCGATLARTLSRQNQKVLLLERGISNPLKETFMAFVAMADQVKLGNKMTTVRGLTVGGSTAMYFAVANPPPLAEFKAIGIDLAAAYRDVTQELPVGPLADELIGPQAKVLQDSALARGLNWNKHDMLIDQAKCQAGYNYEAKWKARDFVEQAVAAGTTLITGATVKKVLVENGQAIGVTYQHKKSWYNIKNHTVYGKKIILAAGGLASPQLLRAAGLTDVGDKGFFCDPGYALYGIVPGLAGTEGFVGSMGCVYQPDIELGDANVGRLLHKLMMFGTLHFKHLRAYEQCVGVGVKVTDSMGGEFKANGSLYKEVSAADMAKLEQGKAEAIKVLEGAGATHIFNVGLTSAGHVGGLIRIGQHVDHYLQARGIANLYVCDGSVLPENVRVTPTLTLVCLAKYLASHLLSEKSENH